MNIKYSKAVLACLLPLVYIHAEDATLIPPNAKAGECYARVVLAPTYKVVEEKVMVKEASNKIDIIPAVYGTIEEEIVITPATKKLIPIEAKYKEIIEDIEVKPAFKIWKTSLKKNAKLISKELLLAAKSKGVDIENAQPLDCFKEYYTPRQFITETENILVQKEHNKTEVIPPQFEIVEKTIVVKAASKKVVEVAAVYEEIEKKVLVEAEKTVWKKGENPAQKVSGATGEIMCLVTIPAKYKTIKKRVLKTAPSTKIVEIPAETKIVKVKKLLVDAQVKNILIDAVYENIEKTKVEKEASFAWFNVNDNIESEFIYAGNQICLTEEKAKVKQVKKIVLETPATIVEESIAAETKIVYVQKLLTPAKEITTPIEAEYRMLSKRIKTSDTRIEWKRILCQTNMTKEIIAKLQSSLSDKGYKTGTPDGIMGRGTRRALDKFQLDSSLATGGITYETLDALGIEL